MKDYAQFSLSEFFSQLSLICKITIRPTKKFRNTPRRVDLKMGSGHFPKLHAIQVT
jgi:hypothetical protein